MSETFKPRFNVIFEKENQGNYGNFSQMLFNRSPANLDERFVFDQVISNNNWQLVIFAFLACFNFQLSELQRQVYLQTKEFND